MLRVLIAASTLVIYNIEIGLYSVLGLIPAERAGRLGDRVLHRRKVLQIITSDPEPVCAYITQGMHRSATVWQATGVYSPARRAFVVLTAPGPASGRGPCATTCAGRTPGPS